MLILKLLGVLLIGIVSGILITLPKGRTPIDARLHYTFIGALVVSVIMIYATFRRYTLSKGEINVRKDLL